MSNVKTPSGYFISDWKLFQAIVFFRLWTDYFYSLCILEILDMRTISFTSGCLQHMKIQIVVQSVG